MKTTEKALIQLLKEANKLTAEEYIDQFQRIIKSDLKKRLKQHRRMKINS